MSRVLCSMPGRAGDLLWALPTVRAIAEHHGDPVDLLIAGEFASMVPLLAQQPYLARVHADPAWNMVDWQPPNREDVISPYDRVHHLGYRRWPELPLPLEIWTGANHGNIDLAPLDLTRPWITVEGPGAPCDIAVGFTEAWFELKVGLLACLDQALQFGPNLLQLTTAGSRWTKEGTIACCSVLACGWLDAARAIRNSDLFFGDCSALHVLAVAMGKPVVLMEPMTERHNPIFWPLGMAGPQVTCVMGNDNKPTFDARACATALQEAL